LGAGEPPRQRAPSGGGGGVVGIKKPGSGGAPAPGGGGGGAVAPKINKTCILGVTIFRDFGLVASLSDCLLLY
jgi:hypothetical protein